MKTKLHFVLSTTMLLVAFSSFGQKNHFVKVNNEYESYKKDKGVVYEFNYDQLSEALFRTTKKSSDKNKSNVLVDFPNTKGELVTYKVVEASVMHPDLQDKYPETRSYYGYPTNSSASVIRFSLSPYKGLSGIILGEKETTLFEPSSVNKNRVNVLNKSTLENGDIFECLTKNASLKSTLKSNLNLKDADDSQKRTYRLALSVTGEYSAYHGGTLVNVNAAIVATLTIVNAVFENDFNVSLQLIANNDDVIYLNSATDPYSNQSNYKNELANTLDTEILEADYDVGHLLAADGFGGDAGCIGCVCNNGGTVIGQNHKGSGYTSDSNPGGFNFDIDLVAHEIGHQFGANHTWTHGGNEGEDVQMEPGSGSTIMGYAGITGATDVQLNSDPYFHAISIQQVTAFIKSTSCASITNTGNTTPTVNAGIDLTLPVGTPFKLVGSGNDVDGDTITYCWEQIDENNAATTYPNAGSTDSNSVLFRSYPPTTENTRYFPKLTDLRFGLNNGQWEKIPTVGRTADFRLTVRDNKPGGANNKHDDMRVTFDAAYGPFEITSQNTSGIIWRSGTNETITWNVNNTNSLTGATNVNILLSTDGGITYNSVASNIPNNGSYILTVPNMPAPYCRLMIEPTNNNFFAINSENFSIDYSITNVCSTFTSTDPNLPLAITDNTGTISETSSLNINTTGIITDVNLTVNITHPYPGDISMTLQSPNNTTAGILTPNSPCRDEDTNIVVTFDDAGANLDCDLIGDGLTMKSPALTLGSWNGESLIGQWTLGLGDYGLADIGTLNAWSMDVCFNVAAQLTTNSYDFNSVKVFPNPNKGEFTIKLNSGLSNSLSVDVFDLRGRVIYSNVFEHSGDLNKTINLNNVQSGMYILNLSDGIRKSTKKIMVE